MHVVRSQVLHVGCWLHWSKHPPIKTIILLMSQTIPNRASQNGKHASGQITNHIPSSLNVRAMVTAGTPCICTNYDKYMHGRPDLPPSPMAFVWYPYIQLQLNIPRPGGATPSKMHQPPDLNRLHLPRTFRESARLCGGGRGLPRTG